MSEHRYYRIYGRFFSASGKWGVLCAAAGCCAAIAGVIALVRAVAPDVVPLSKSIDDTTAYTVAGICALITAVLVVVARVHARSRHLYTRSTRWGIVAIAVAIMFTGLAAAVDTMFPNGLIEAAVRDEAPYSDQSAMDDAIDTIAEGACTGGWQNISSTGYPDATAFRMCSASLVAYATFDNDSALLDYQSSLVSQASTMMAERSDQSDIQWYTLSGTRWIVIGQQEMLETLHQDWGGELVAVETDDEDSNS